MANQHRWSFFRAGDFDQVKLRTGEDLMNLESLDQKLWVALACPTSGLEIDARTLSLIDTDQDGRVRASELIAAVKFAGGNLKNPDDLLKGNETLSLAAIEDADAGGRDAAGVGAADPRQHRQAGRDRDLDRGRRRSRHASSPAARSTATA